MNSFFLTNRGCCSWSTSWDTGDGGDQELPGPELEAACWERPWRHHVLCWEGDRSLFFYIYISKAFILTERRASVFLSVSQAQIAGRGWTLRSLLSLHDLHCSISPRGSPTASVSAAATPPASASRQTPPKPPLLATSLVRTQSGALSHHNSSSLFGDE